MGKRLAAMVAGLLLSMGSAAYAVTVTDVQDFSKNTSTTYFVDSDGNKYSSPYYRWYNEDWGWKHAAISGSVTSASVNISAFDVDWAYGEVDKVYAYDNGVKTLLGTLTGQDNTWAFTTFDLGSNFFDDINAGLEIFVDIDSTNNYSSWALTLAKSALSIDGGQLPDPDPGPSQPVPEPSTFALLGLGAAGVLFARRRAKRS